LSAPVKPSSLRLDARETFRARAEARALLWEAGEISLHDAVDELWRAAERDGLVKEFGADDVQAFLAEIFTPLEREPEILPAREAAAKCLAAEQRANEVYREPSYVPEQTLKAAAFLHDLGDFDRFKAWFDRHDARTRDAIARHLRKRAKKRRGK
jgi:hypothetical protein